MGDENQLSPHVVADSVGAWDCGSAPDKGAGGIVMATNPNTRVDPSGFTCTCAHAVRTASNTTAAAVLQLARPISAASLPRTGFPVF